MVAEVRMKNGGIDKFSKVVSAGVLSSYPDQLYIQTRVRDKPREIFIPLDRVRAYQIRDVIR